ncbi:MAG: hypothetical protein QF752_02375 [Planctomycetota bacterium]|jgi:hypothetical protein|nr:hypothetical protein [Planctomycetota bacterium]
MNLGVPLATVFQDPVLALFLGAMAGFFAPTMSLSTALGHPSGSLRRLLIFLLFLWSPIVMYFAWGYPGWSWWYLLSEEDIRWWYGVVPLLLQWILMVVGYFWIVRPRLQGRMDQARRRVGGTALIAVMSLLLPLGVVMQIGTTQEYREGRTQWLFQHRLFLELLGLGTLIVLGWLGVVLGWGRRRRPSREGV